MTIEKNRCREINPTVLNELGTLETTEGGIETDPLAAAEEPPPEEETFPTAAGTEEPAAAEAEIAPPTVVTDRADYAPGETVTIAATGFKFGSTIEFAIAYEPIWAIGTGETRDATEDNRAIGPIRKQLTYKDMPIQCGGKGSGIAQQLLMPTVELCRCK
jgi:hypothetical protein